MSKFSFSVDHTLKNMLGRTGTLTTSHGMIKTPAFVVVGTKATVKGVTPEMVNDIGAQVVLGNTYHLYLQPGDEIVKEAGGIGSFMNWNGPTMTDSGGFQVFSLGEAFGAKVSKVASGEVNVVSGRTSYPSNNKLASISEEGVTFRSHIDGSSHLFTPERSMELQWNLGADVIFSFDECTSPLAPRAYQREAMERTHRWAQRGLDHHRGLKQTGVGFSPKDRDPTPVFEHQQQALFGVVQGGRFQDLREESAQVLSEMDFDGFGIGGSFDKKDMNTAVSWVNHILPPEKPRHLLGIGEPVDLFGGIEHGCDLFDCVSPTRLARHGTLYTVDGPVNMHNARFKNDMGPIDPETASYTSLNYSRAYLAHLYRSREMLAATLGSVHNLYFIVHLVDSIRMAILDNRFESYRDQFLRRYYH